VLVELVWQCQCIVMQIRVTLQWLLVGIQKFPDIFAVQARLEASRSLDICYLFVRFSILEKTEKGQLKAPASLSFSNRGQKHPNGKIKAAFVVEQVKHNPAHASQLTLNIFDHVCLYKAKLKPPSSPCSEPAR